MFLSAIITLTLSSASQFWLFKSNQHSFVVKCDFLLSWQLLLFHLFNYLFIFQIRYLAFHSWSTAGPLRGMMHRGLHWAAILTIQFSKKMTVTPSFKQPDENLRHEAVWQQINKFQNYIKTWCNSYHNKLNTSANTKLDCIRHAAMLFAKAKLRDTKKQKKKNAARWK